MRQSWLPSRDVAIKTPAVPGEPDHRLGVRSCRSGMGWTACEIATAIRSTPYSYGRILPYALHLDALLCHFSVCSAGMAKIQLDLSNQVGLACLPAQDWLV